MPSAMTMQRPHPRIIRLELHHQMARPRRPRLAHHLRIPSLRVRRVPRAPIPHAVALGQHEEIVTVQMHRVRGVCGGDGISHVDADIGGFAGVVDVPLFGVGEVALVGFKQDGVAEVERVWIRYFAFDVEGGG